MSNKVHVWVGNNFQSEANYQKYFQLDYSTEGDFSDPNYEACGFCEDLGIDWYDEDFIGIMPRKDSSVSLDDILMDAAVDSDELDVLKDKCKDLGLVQANAIFWYGDANLNITIKNDNNYNGLKYIGLFDGD